MRLASGWRASRHGERTSRHRGPRNPTSQDTQTQNRTRKTLQESQHTTAPQACMSCSRFMSSSRRGLASSLRVGVEEAWLKSWLDALAVACSWSYSVLHTDVSGNVLFVFWHCCRNSHCAVFPRSSAFVPVSSQVAVGLPQLLLRPREKPQVQ